MFTPVPTIEGVPMIYRTIALSALLVLGACANSGGGGPPVAATTTPAGTKVTGVNGASGDINGTIRPGSKFSRIRIGMGSGEVESLIGPPTDTASHITGKAFIPFYFGGDSSQTEKFYKGEGQLTYSPQSIGSSLLVLTAITVDANERGFAH
jgi:hypothetical protein